MIQNDFYTRGENSICQLCHLFDTTHLMLMVKVILTKKRDITISFYLKAHMIQLGSLMHLYR